MSTKNLCISSVCEGQENYNKLFVLNINSCAVTVHVYL